MNLDATKYLNALQESEQAVDLVNMRKQLAYNISTIPDQLKTDEGGNIYNIGSTFAEVSGGALLSKVGGVVKDYVKDKVGTYLQSVKDEVAAKVKDVLPEGVMDGEASTNDLTNAISSGDIEGAISSAKNLFGNVADNLVSKAQGILSDAVDTATNSAQNVIQNATSDLETLRDGILPEFNQDAMTSRFQSLFSGEFEDGSTTLQRAVVQSQSYSRALPKVINESQLPEQQGDVEMQNMSGQDIPLGEDNPFDGISIAPSEVAPVDVVDNASSVIDSIGNSISTATETANATAETLTSAASNAAELGASLAADAGAEIAGAVAGVGLSDFLGPIGLLGGIIGGGVAIYEGVKKEKEAASAEEQASQLETESQNYGFTNPSAQFL